MFKTTGCPRSSLSENLPSASAGRSDRGQVSACDQITGSVNAGAGNDQVSISDSADQEIFHTFKLSVVDELPAGVKQDPGQAAPLSSAVPDPASLSGETARASAERALTYMGLEPGTRLTQISVDTVFLGSCTNGRLEDLRAAAEVLRGRKVASGVRMLVVPGSMEVKVAAEREGLAEVFTAAGAEWRSAGCSMCLGMNPDKLAPGQRSASTSNRNFEGRQGKGARTHLVSPQVAAATAVTGRLTAPADL